MEDYGLGVVQNYLELNPENHLPGLDEMDIDNLDEWIDYDGGNGPQIVNTGAINLFPNVMDNPETIDPQLLFNWDPNQAGTATSGSVIENEYNLYPPQPDDSEISGVPPPNVIPPPGPQQPPRIPGDVNPQPQSGRPHDWLQGIGPNGIQPPQDPTPSAEKLMIPELPPIPNEKMEEVGSRRENEDQDFIDFYQRPESDWLPSWGEMVIRRVNRVRKRGETFQYKERTTELDPNLTFTREQLATFLRGEGHPNPHRRPTLWIQNTPTKVNDWYLSSQKSTRCRYDGCPAKKNTIAQGYFRIAFDEFSHYTGERLNPYHNAGYIHLDCFEEIFDLGYLIHFGADRLRIRIRPDTREFYLQDSNPASLTRNYESMIDMYDEWVAGQRDRAQQLEARNAGVIAYTGLEPPLNRPGNEHENRLGCKLTDHHLSKQPKIRKKVRDERGGVTISDHRGSLRKQMKLRREKRDGNNHRTPSTQGTPAPSSNGNGSGSASQEGSPDLMPGDERFRILLRRRMEPLRLRHERETQELEQRHTQERQELERQILGEYQQEQQQSQLETQQGRGMQNKRPRPSNVDGGEKEEDEDQERTPKRPR
ncbi:uncharacterized protein C8A04DRAFT_28471 [Dichotomopilus funicola]|uniref:Uncharacterized protein n=1 Tax=Dichotomopilus funicola TaxID=1934379 RepID=A0AAN6ZLQ1_9PEZI|nr:hypothetical protein C8A04DRAFT_28471 [Dichotomopilus funicola]